jgi:hypothetical protein
LRVNVGNALRTSLQSSLSATKPVNAASPMMSTSREVDIGRRTVGLVLNRLGSSSALDTSLAVASTSLALDAGNARRLQRSAPQHLDCIDVTGAQVRTCLQNADRVGVVVVWLDDALKVVPSHGELSDPDALPFPPVVPKRLAESEVVDTAEITLDTSPRPPDDEVAEETSGLSKLKESWSDPTIS